VEENQQNAKSEDNPLREEGERSKRTRRQYKREEQVLADGEDSFLYQFNAERVEAAVVDEDGDWVRIVCLSDTHTIHHTLTVPDGDILLHAGDFTTRGPMQQVEDFNVWLGSLPHKHKVVIAGGFFSFRQIREEKSCWCVCACVWIELCQYQAIIQIGNHEAALEPLQNNVAKIKSILSNCTYLQVPTTNSL
jgi:hypothetical protein